MTLLLNWRLWTAVLFTAVLAWAGITVYRSGAHSVQEKWDAEKVATERAAQVQAARNRDLQRQAELKYVVQGESRDHYFVTTVKEIRDAAAPMASCPVPDAVRLRINAAIDCAGADPAPTCGADGKVPGP